ncbi:MAG TPA: NADH-quinone oxidoreductase subunit L [Gaiellaceae bacterium]|jgi:NADH-quinone oxidoreductase subunit L|nr:NADH-quinone oxidoreductase subunit L [Gaiellaceae bacterium]
MIAAAWIALFAPAAAVLAIALAGTRITRSLAGWLAAGSALASFICSVIAFVALLGDSPDERTHYSTLWTWLSAGSFKVGAEILVDPLSVFMMLVVSGVGFLILAYAVGYMDGDAEERRYHAYKALFLFSMLLLVQAGNLLLLLAGWGMVGLSSYLLINFWHFRATAVAAGKKAFIMNAFGDATFVLALFLLIQRTGSVDFNAVLNSEVVPHGSTVAVLVALGLLGGAVAKSAQIPLHTWLPDAMEGPTPVSALIHAATMVTAGVYLIVRTNVLFELAPAIQDLAGILGAVTILFAGLVALVQTDIKRVIAYSTMSQIGYMFAAVGLSAYGPGLFHLMTHAFFKALLFMAAGIVIHALSDEQDIRKMGGIGRALPFTYRVFVVGALALAAIPPFAGFFSKDSILATLAAGGTLGWILWTAGAIGAFLTALYTFRLLFIVFWGEMTPFAREHLHLKRFEGGLAMAWPVGVLAVLSFVGGWLQVPWGWQLVTDWIDPVAESAAEATGTTLTFSVLASTALALAGIWLAWRWYGRPSSVPERARLRWPWAARTLEHKFYVDEAYDRVFYDPADRGSLVLTRYVEQPVFLASLGELGAGVRATARRLSAVQTGFVREYAFALAAGLAVLAVVFILVT